MPRGLREAEARLLGDITGRWVLEVGCGAAAAGRWLVTQGAEVVAVDLSAGMLRHATQAADRTGIRVPPVQADAMALPLGDATFELAFTAFGAVPFVDDSAAVMREVFRILRSGGRWIFSATHPIECMGSSWSTGQPSSLTAGGTVSGTTVRSVAEINRVVVVL